MSKLNLREYKKEESKSQGSVTRSILIRPDHREFLDKNKLNLSKLVRDFLDSVMRQK